MQTLSQIQITGLIQFKTGLTAPQLAAEYKFPKSLVYKAIVGFQTKTCEQIRKQIAADTESSLNELWPESATKEGK